MSEEQLKALLSAAKLDATLHEKLKSATDIDAIVSIANDAGFLISSEDVKDEPGLSEEELEAVAGGIFTTPAWCDVSLDDPRCNPF